MSVLRPGTASKTISPPFPPSPPSGPPNSTNFSRRKLTAPGPPAPERMKILAWSRKCISAGQLGDARRKGNHVAIPAPKAPVSFGRLSGRFTTVPNREFLPGLRMHGIQMRRLTGGQNRGMPVRKYLLAAAAAAAIATPAAARDHSGYFGIDGGVLWSKSSLHID